MRKCSVSLVIILAAQGCRDTTIIAAEYPGDSSSDGRAADTDTDSIIATDYSGDSSSDNTDADTNADVDTNTDTDTDTDMDTNIDSDTDTDSICTTDIATISTSASSYPVVNELPNPFQFLDGRKVTSQADWRCRREELLKLIQAIEYGPYPPKPDTVTGSLNGNTLTVTVEADGESISFDAAITKPGGSGPFPAFIVISTLTPCVTAQDVNTKGIAYITYNPDDISTDGTAYSGKFYTLYNTSPHTGNLMAWAWAIHRIMDALEVTPAVGIDPTKIAAAGCRRYGKAALVAGAFDERVALTVPCGGGSGGINSWRAAEAANLPGIDERETIHNIGGAPNWFTENFITNWENNVYQLPFDAHEVIALVAPRAIIAQEGMDDYYNTNPEGGPFQSMWAAKKVFDYLGAGELAGWVTDDHSNDVMTTRELNAIMDLADRVLFGKTGITTTFDQSATPPTISWEAPADSSR